MQDRRDGQVVNGARNWGAGFMPAVYQGVRVEGGSEPIPNLKTPQGVTEAEQLGKWIFRLQAGRIEIIKTEPTDTAIREQPSP